MSLSDKMKSAFSSSTGTHTAEFEAIIDSSWKQYFSKDEFFRDVSINEVVEWSIVKNWPDKKKIEFIHWLVPQIHQYTEDRLRWSPTDKELQKNAILLAFLQALFRNKLLLEDEDASSLHQLFSLHKINKWSAFTSWPIGPMVNQIERQCLGKPVSPILRTVLAAIKADIEGITTHKQVKEHAKLIDKIDTILFAAENGAAVVKPVLFLGEDEFTGFANWSIEELPDAQKPHWFRLISLAQKVSGAKSSTKYLDDTKTIINELGIEKFRNVVQEWLQFLADLKEDIQNHNSYNYNSDQFLSAVNTEAVKAFIWICANFHDSKIIHALAALAERAFRKIPGNGPAAASVGNACLFALYTSKELDGIGQLSKLKLRIKHGSAQNLIDKYLQQAAKEQGVTVSEIEDMTIEDYGLADGKRVFLFDDYRAELLISGVGKTAINWFKPDGSPQKSVPAIVKEKHKAGLQKLKDVSKHIEQTLVAQRDRIDRMLRSNRMISWEKFTQYYLDHGLMSFLARKIIWNFHQENKTVQGIFYQGKWINANNECIRMEGIVTASLWHPVHASIKEITAWRELVISAQLLQPLKQAFREVYLLTDAEINTKSYSNRMAAHILRQHQFNSLAKGRGWRYSLMGAYDNGIDKDKASLELAEADLRAEYWVSEVNADGEMNDTGIWNYVSTDQVRFINNITNETVDLLDVPSLVFSEVMRDVDLFVGVASVGNDPVWHDTGGLPAHRDYWKTYSFGDLSEVAKNRKQILTSLIPRLKIKDVATVKDKFLVVKGKLRTYKIHIGSTNILMEPNDEYLCIVPDRSQKNHTENIFLPFEGDNGLSVILSKAFLLAEDDTIADPTIISQINRR